MQNLPLISVIIPVYNAASYLAQCIENILYQTYKNIEIIVVDDGSTDNVTEIAQKYPVKLISKENEGVSSARNNGLRAAAGAYVHFMDVDDLINLDFYERMVTAALSCDADIAFCGIINEREPILSRVIEHKFIVLNKEDKLALTNVGHDGYCFNYLIKRSFLVESKLNFDENVSTAEDLIFSMQAVFFANKIVTAPGAVYYYKMRRQSALARLTKRGKKEQQDAWRPVKMFKENFEKQHQINTNQSPVKWTRYRFLGIHFMKKKTQVNGLAKWYLFGLCILQIRNEQG